MQASPGLTASQPLTGKQDVAIDSQRCGVGLHRLLPLFLTLVATTLPLQPAQFGGGFGRRHFLDGAGGLAGSGLQGVCSAKGATSGIKTGFIESGITIAHRIVKLLGVVGRADPRQFGGGPLVSRVELSCCFECLLGASKIAIGLAGSGCGQLLKQGWQGGQPGLHGRQPGFARFNQGCQIQRCRCRTGIATLNSQARQFQLLVKGIGNAGLQRQQLG